MRVAKERRKEIDGEGRDLKGVAMSIVNEMYFQNVGVLEETFKMIIHCA